MPLDRNGYMAGVSFEGCALSDLVLNLLIRTRSFSIRFSAGLSRRFTGPRDVGMCLADSKAVSPLLRNWCFLDTIFLLIEEEIFFSVLCGAVCFWLFFLNEA